MDRKSIVSRDGTHISLNAKPKSNLNTTRSVQVPKLEMISKTKSTLDTLPRNFRCTKSPTKTVKKAYQKNSEKYIKPPEKSGKSNNDNIDGRSNSSSTMLDSIVSTRGSSPIPNSCIPISRKRSTDSIPLSLATPYSRLDTKIIVELETRVENLQSILLRKVEILRSRNPDRLKKEYKFIALVMGEKSKLLVKESDAKSFPILPAKSMEDLNRKTSEFFKACLLSFVDKLREYIKDGRDINCDEVYAELKNEEKEHSEIIHSWINEVRVQEEDERTLTNSELESDITPELKPNSDLELEQKIMAEMRNLGTQTDVEAKKMQIDHEVQTEQELVENNSAKYSDLCAKIDKVRLENYELKDQLREQKDYYIKELENLNKNHSAKISDIMECWEREKTELVCKEEVLLKEQKTNIGLSQQASELRTRLNELMDKHEILLKQTREEDHFKSELDRYRNEVEQLKMENTELRDLKNQFLKKLNQRYEQIELLEKEVKLQKRIVQNKEEEMNNLRKKYDGKIRENRQIKDSLEARTKLIDHLRDAVQIDQKKIREYELLLETKTNSSGALEYGDAKRKDAKWNALVLNSKSALLSQIKCGKRSALCSDDVQESTFDSSFNTEILNAYRSTAEQETRLPRKRADRSKKKNTPARTKEELPIDNPLEIEKPTRPNKLNKQSRDIIVKKYDM